MIFQGALAPVCILCLGMNGPQHVLNSSDIAEQIEDLILITLPNVTFSSQNCRCAKQGFSREGTVLRAQTVPGVKK